MCFIYSRSPHMYEYMRIFVLYQHTRSTTQTTIVLHRTNASGKLIPLFFCTYNSSIPSFRISRNGHGNGNTMISSEHAIVNALHCLSVVQNHRSNVRWCLCTHAVCPSASPYNRLLYHYRMGHKLCGRPTLVDVSLLRH